jgi:hypothetical protein
MSNKYIDKVIEGELEELRQSVGGRNNSLFRVATRLFQFVEGGSLQEDYVVSTLTDTAVGLGLPHMEIRTTLKSARIKVMGNPASIPTAQSSITNNLITPEPANSPNDEWCNTAKAFLNWSIFNMWDEKYCQGLDYLSSRKIDDEAILRYSIGYNPTTMYRPKIKWGISDDESSMLVIPEGIVIPYFVDGKIWKIEVRSTEAKNKHTIAGSSNAIWGLDNIDYNKPVMLTEGVINGLTIASYSNNIIQPVALGAITHGRKIKFMSKLSACSLILLSTDSDIAGETGANWWKDVLSHNSVRWKPLFGDINDMALRDLDVQSWIESGLDFGYDTIYTNE